MLAAGILQRIQERRALKTGSREKASRFGANKVDFVGLRRKNCSQRENRVDDNNFPLELMGFMDRSAFLKGVILTILR